MKSMLKKALPWAAWLLLVLGVPGCSIISFRIPDEFADKKPKDAAPADAGAVPAAPAPSAPGTDAMPLPPPPMP
jgi:hypothetical protein